MAAIQGREAEAESNSTALHDWLVQQLGTEDESAIQGREAEAESNSTALYDWLVQKLGTEDESAIQGREAEAESNSTALHDWLVRKLDAEDESAIQGNELHINALHATNDVVEMFTGKVVRGIVAIDMFTLTFKDNNCR
jgi:hypothetical protein